MIDRIFYKTEGLNREQMLEAFKEAGKVCRRVEFRRNLDHFVGDVRDATEMIRTAQWVCFYALKETTNDGFVEYEIGCRFSRFADDDSVCNIRMTEAHGKALFEKYGFKEHQ